VIEAGVWGTTAVMAVSLVEYVHRFRAIWRLGPGARLDPDGNVLSPGNRGSGEAEAGVGG
jgi:hypothetical protein